MKKFLSMFFFIVCIVILDFMFCNSDKCEATQIGDSKYLQRAEKGFYSIQRWNGSEWIYVTYSVINYSDDAGQCQIAYCVNPDKKGIGYISGEVEGYNVKLKELISNQKMWRAVTNGYPYKTPEQMGVENEQDAYLATKMALYAMLRNQTSSDIRLLYRAGEDKVAGESMDDIQRRGNKVINAICEMVDIGNNGSETMQSNNILSIEKTGDFKQDGDRDYISQCFKVKSTVECSEYTVERILNFPSGAKVTNINGIEQSTFKGGDEFKVMIPKASLIEDVAGTIEISGVCKNFPIYYAECEIGDYQNYVLCCDSYSKNINHVGTIDLKICKSKLTITKECKDTKMPIQGVEFSIKYMDGEDVGSFITNDEGNVIIDNLRQGKVIIKETKTGDSFVLDKEEHVVDLEYGDDKSIVIENELKKVELNESEIKSRVVENKKENVEKLPRTGSVDYTSIMLLFSLIGLFVKKVVHL